MLDLRRGISLRTSCRSTAHAVCRMAPPPGAFLHSRHRRRRRFRRQTKQCRKGKVFDNHCYLPMGGFTKFFENWPNVLTDKMEEMCGRGYRITFATKEKVSAFPVFEFIRKDQGIEDPFMYLWQPMKLPGGSIDPNIWNATAKGRLPGRWAPGEPDNRDGKEECVVFHATRFTLYDVRCDTNGQFFCKSYLPINDSSESPEPMTEAPEVPEPPTRRPPPPPAPAPGPRPTGEGPIVIPTEYRGPTTTTAYVTTREISRGQCRLSIGEKIWRNICLRPAYILQRYPDNMPSGASCGYKSEPYFIDKERADLFLDSLRMYNDLGYHDLMWIWIPVRISRGSKRPYEWVSAAGGDLTLDWEPGQPDNIRGQEECLQFHAFRHTLRDVRCDVHGQFFCKSTFVIYTTYSTEPPTTTLPTTPRTWPQWPSTAPPTGPDEGPEPGPQPGPDEGPEPGPQPGPQPGPDEGPEPGPQPGPQPGPDEGPEPEPFPGPDNGPTARPDPEDHTAPHPYPYPEPDESPDSGEAIKVGACDGLEKEVRGFCFMPRLRLERMPREFPTADPCGPSYSAAFVNQSLTDLFKDLLEDAEMKATSPYDSESLAYLWEPVRLPGGSTDKVAWAKISGDQLPTSWASGQPDNHDGQEECVQFNAKTHTLRDVRCWGDTAQFLCFRSTGVEEQRAAGTLAAPSAAAEVGVLALFAAGHLLARA